MERHILIAGDICPIGRNQALFQKGNAQALLGDLQPDFETADLLIVNLECSFIHEETPIEKTGPNLGVPVDCVNGLKAMGINVVGLANNHVMDHGPQGLWTTIRTLEEQGIDYVGAGENLVNASKVFCQQVGQVRIGIMAVAEHEFSIATKDTPGANPLNLIEYVRQMRTLKQQLNYMIVLLHGGKEHYSYPSPALQQICRFMVEEGANAVICQHSHCPGCYEQYKGGHIVYGQGNLIFDANPKQQEEWNRGFLVRLSIKADKTAEMDLIPYIQSDERPGARRLSKGKEALFMKDLQTRSACITQEAFVEQNWQDFCRTQRYLYFSLLRGHNRPLRLFNRIAHFTDWIYSRRRLMTLQNIIRCETHREVLQTILSEM